MDIENVNGLLIVQQALGYLLQFEGKTYDPNYRVVPVSAADADRHNKELDRLTLLRLDSATVDGDVILLYFDDDTGAITTFTAKRVATGVRRRDGVVTFYHGDKTFAADPPGDASSARLFQRVK